MGEFPLNSSTKGWIEYGDILSLRCLQDEETMN